MPIVQSELRSDLWKTATSLSFKIIFAEQYYWRWFLSAETSQIISQCYLLSKVTTIPKSYDNWRVSDGDLPTCLEESPIFSRSSSCETKTMLVQYINSAEASWMDNWSAKAF